MGMHAAAIKAATARRREMNRDMVLYSSGCGWAQNQAYLRGRPTTIPRHRHVSNAATSICSGAAKLCGASMHQCLPANAHGHSRQLLLRGGPPWGILPPRAALVGGARVVVADSRGGLYGAVCSLAPFRCVVQFEPVSVRGQLQVHSGGHNRNGAATTLAVRARPAAPIRDTLHTI